jgi:hypothetical protein
MTFFRVTLVLVSLACFPAAGWSQGEVPATPPEVSYGGQAAPAPAYSVSGSLREYVNLFGYSPRRLDPVQTRLQMNLVSRLGGHAAFRVSGSGTYAADRQSLALDLKEAYIGWYSTFFEIYAGRQVTTWGKAEGINPTDILNPQDLTNPWEDPAIRKKGRFSVKGNARLLNLQVDLVWQPELGPSLFPGPGSPWTFSADSMPAIPEQTSHNATKAVKVSWAGSRLDVSFCYVDGWGNRPIPSGMYRTKMAGADLASDLGPVRVWAEGAYFRTADADGIDPLVPNHSLQAVAGAGGTLPGNIQAALQYVQEVITGIDDETERTAEEPISGNLVMGLPLRQALALHLGRDLDREGKHRAELVTIYDIAGKGVFCNPRVTLTPAPVLSVELGGLVFAGGDSGTVFNRFGRNDSFYGKCLYSF